MRGVVREEGERDFAPTGFAHLALDDRGSAALDRHLLQFGKTAAEFLFLDSLTRSRARLADPFAVVLLDRDYWLAGHLLETRATRTDVKFSYCSYNVTAPAPSYPPVSVVYVPDRAVLDQLSERSPIFEAARNVLTGAESDFGWLCLLDALPHAWSSAAEARDRALFNQLRPASLV